MPLRDVTIQHQQQPTPWSCGLAVAAMATGQPVEAMRAILPTLRSACRRRRLRREYVNVGELRAMIERHGRTMDRRAPGRPPLEALAVLRIPNGRVTGWHWCLWAPPGVIHDPMRDGPFPRWITYSSWAQTSHYIVRASM